MTPVQMNPLNYANLAVGIDPKTGSHFVRLAISKVRSRARPPKT